MKMPRSVLLFALAAMLANGLLLNVYGQESATASAVKRAYDQLDQWLGAEDFGTGWRRYLLSKELGEQIKLGKKADKKVVRQILEKYSGKVAGLQQPRYVAVRQALQAWLDELMTPTPEELPQAAREAKDQFTPVSEQALRQSKATLQQAVTRLETFLGPGAYTAGWRKVVMLGDLQAQLAKGSKAKETADSKKKPATGKKAGEGKKEKTNGKKEAAPQPDSKTDDADEKPDVEVLAEVLKRFSREYRGLEMREFTAVHDALSKYLTQLRIAQDPSAEKNYRQQLDDLAGALTAYRASSKPADLQKAAVALSWLEARDLAPKITAVARRYYWKPNLLIEASAKLVTYGFGEDVDETNPINEYRNNAQIVGTGRTIGKSVAQLVPYGHVGVVHTLFDGTTYSTTTAYASQATVYSSAETYIKGLKQISLNRRGFTDYPATAAAVTNSRTTGINSAYADIARDRVEQNRPSNEARAARQAEDKIRKRMDDNSRTQVEDVNNNYYNKYVKRLTDRDAFPAVVTFSTTKESLLLSSIQAEGTQWAALDEAPKAPEDKAMSVRVHETWLNNTTLAMYGERTVPEQEFRDEITDMLGSTPEALKRKSDNPPWTITFAAQAPFTINIGQDTALIALRGTKYQSGKSAPRNTPMNIVASYRVSKGPGGPKLVRQGALQVLPPSLIAQLDKDGDGWLNPDEEKSMQPGSLTGAQASLRSELLESFGSLLDEQIEPSTIKLTGRWESLGQLKADYLAAAPGWLTIGYQIDKPAGKKAEKSAVKSAAKP
jgi:hypothetical protein